MFTFRQLLKKYREGKVLHEEIRSGKEACEGGVAHV